MQKVGLGSKVSSRGQLGTEQEMTIQITGAELSGRFCDSYPAIYHSPRQPRPIKSPNLPFYSTPPVPGTFMPSWVKGVIWTKVTKSYLARQGGNHPHLRG